MNQAANIIAQRDFFQDLAKNGLDRRRDYEILKVGRREGSVIFTLINPEVSYAVSRVVEITSSETLCDVTLRTIFTDRRKVSTSEGDFETVRELIHAVQSLNDFALDQLLEAHDVVGVMDVVMSNLRNHTRTKVTAASCRKIMARHITQL